MHLLEENRKNQVHAIVNGSAENIFEHYIETIMHESLMMAISRDDKPKFMECRKLDVPSQCLPRLFIDYLRKRHRQITSLSSSLATIIAHFEKALQRCQNVLNRRKCQVLIVSQLELTANR